MSNYKKTDVVKKTELIDSYEGSRLLQKAFIDRALSASLVPEGKLVLLAMLWMGKKEATLIQLMEWCNAPLAEVSDGAQSLRSAFIANNKVYDRVVLSPEWTQ